MTSPWYDPRQERGILLSESSGSVGIDPGGSRGCPVWGEAGIDLSFCCFWGWKNWRDHWATDLGLAWVPSRCRLSGSPSSGSSRIRWARRGGVRYGNGCNAYTFLIYLLDAQTKMIWYKNLIIVAIITSSVCQLSLLLRVGRHQSGFKCSHVHPYQPTLTNGTHGGIGAWRVNQSLMGVQQTKEEGEWNYNWSE